MLFLLLLMLCTRPFVLSGLNSEQDSNMTSSSSSCIKREMQALLVFQAGLADDGGCLFSWGSEEDQRDCCKWKGVSCDGHTGRVVMLHLSKCHLAGNISSSLLQLNQLSSLVLSGNNFQTNPIPYFLGSLTKLQHLDLSAANLSGPIPYHLAKLSRLSHLDLSRNFLVGIIPDIFKDFTSLTYVDLSENQFEGAIPESFGNCSSLVHLDLSGNCLNGSMPDFSGCSSLTELFLHYNALNGRIPEFTGCLSLTTLSLSHNALNGSIPDFTGCPSLESLVLSSNHLSGSLPMSVGQLLNLEYLDVSSNFLMGIISCGQFLNLTNLIHLDLSFNSLALHVSSHCEIPFQLKTLRLQSCKLGPHFPEWIRTQRNYTHLDISSAGISDNIPSWFWHLPRELRFLNLSSNEIKGMLPDMMQELDNYAGMDLSFNHLEGSVPILPYKLSALNLAGNRFSGTLSFLCQISWRLTFLDLSSNLFSGRLPDCWKQFREELVVLNLARNNLSGEIPTSVGSLFRLEALYLRHNAFIGELPVSLSNCVKLRFLDLGGNKLSGNIPAWVGESLPELHVLILRSNRFFGSIPSQICWLKNLQFLDFSVNSLSGTVPKCFYNFTAMVSSGTSDEFATHSYSTYIAYFSLHRSQETTTGYVSYDALKRNWDPCFTHRPEYYSCPADYVEEASYIDNALVAWKGIEREFGSGLRLLKSIDLSINNLSGELPHEITSLLGLVSLNLSINKLHGEVPQQIGLLKSLQALDLSRNNFSGNIPTSLSELTFLSFLNLSDNNLSGKIPSGTQLQSFNASVYSGNAGLCGPPLTLSCAVPPATIVDQENDQVDEQEDEADFWRSYLMGMGAGFAASFWGICVALFFNRWFRHFLFTVLIHLKNWIYVAVVVHVAKFQRMF